MAILALLLPLAFGWLVARGLLNFRPVWALHLTCAALAVALGAGWASIAQLILLWAGLAQPALSLGVDALGCAAALLVFRKRTAPEAGEVRPAYPHAWIGWTALGLTTAFCLAGFAAGWSGNPHGDWDAFSIWNLRAKWLASPDAWRYAVQPGLDLPYYGAAHPGYPLLLSGLVAHIWLADGAFDPVWPMAVALLFSLSIPALLTGALAAGRSVVVGLLASAVLLGADIFVLQGPKQYADVPLSMYLLGAVALTALAWQRDWHAGTLALAGACAGLAWWTKNEGLPFVATLAFVVLWTARRRALPFAWGALPGLLAMAAFRLALAPPEREVPLPATFSGVLQQISQPSRWWAPVAGYMQPEWLLPLACLAVAGWTLKVNRQQGLTRALWLLVPVAVLKLAGYLVFVLTTSDQKWHIETAASRLIAQLWPASVFAIVWAMGRPEDEAVAVKVKSGKRAR